MPGLHGGALGHALVAALRLSRNPQWSVQAWAGQPTFVTGYLEIVGDRSSSALRHRKGSWLELVGFARTQNRLLENVDAAAGGVSDDILDIERNRRSRSQ